MESATIARGPLGILSPKREQLLGIRRGEGPEQHRVGYRENRSRRADAESEREDDDDGEAWILYYLASREVDIAQEVFEPRNAVSNMEALLCRRHIAERDSRQPVRLLLAQAFTPEFVGFKFQMRLDLVSEIVFCPLAPEHAYASPPPNASTWPALPPRTNPIALVSRSHSLVFSTSCSRPFSVNE